MGADAHAPRLSVSSRLAPAQEFVRSVQPYRPAPPHPDHVSDRRPRSHSDTVALSAEVVETSDLTAPSQDGWAVDYRIRRDDGEELHAEVRCWQKAHAAADRAANAEALAAIADRGSSRDEHTLSWRQHRCALLLPTRGAQERAARTARQRASSIASQRYCRACDSRPRQSVGPPGRGLDRACDVRAPPEARQKGGMGTRLVGV